jgi:hypothetical protein
MKRLFASLILSFIVGSLSSGSHFFDKSEGSFQRQRVVEVKFDVAFGGIVFFP